MDQSGYGKPARMWPALGALGLAFALGSTDASAQAGRSWVDPPANLKAPLSPAPSNAAAETVTNPPAPKAEAPAKAADTDKPAAPPKPDAKPAVAAKPAPDKPAVADKPADAEKPAVADRPAPARAAVAEKPQRPKRPVRSAAARPERREAATRAERPSRRALASRPSPRGAPVAEARELEVMRLRTLEFPDGRRVEVLTPVEREDYGWPFR